MTDRQVNALAAFIADGRPDWQAPGIVAELRRQRDHHDPWQLAVALIRRAADPDNRTPQLQPFDHQPGRIGCREHPGAGVRTDGRCGVCWTDVNAATEPLPLRRRGVAPTADQRQAMLAALRPTATMGEPA